MILFKKKVITALFLLMGLLPAFVHAQNARIKGTVLDENGSPLPGVTVSAWINNAYNSATQTDSVGFFSIDNLAIGKKYDFQFSYVGYDTYTEKAVAIVNNIGNLLVHLKPGNKQLNDIVVVGYGTQKKVNLTGAVSQVDATAFENKPVASVGQALQGAVPNLNINFGDGHPGSVATFNVRGFASINNKSGSPLIIIDGVPGEIDLLNPNDISSVSVLKDAASAAVYGARAAFGVILITTKAARKGKLNVSYGYSYGIQTPTTSTDFMTDGYQQLKLVDEAFSRNTGSSYSGYTDADYEELKKRQTDKSLPSIVKVNRNGRDMYVSYGNTDWWHYLYRKSTPQMEHHFTVSGGTEKTTVLISGRYFSQSGLYQDYLGNDSYRSYNLRAKINTQVSDWLNLYTNTQFSTGQNNWPGSGKYGNNTGLYNHAMAAYVPRNPDGSLRFRTNLNNYAASEYPELTYGKSKGKETKYDITQILGFTMNFFRNKLKVDGNFSYEYMPSYLTQGSAKFPWSVYPGVFEYNGNSSLSETNNTNQHQTLNLFGTYTNDWGDHHLKATLGYNQELQQFKYTSAKAYDLLSDDLNQLDLATGSNYTYGNENEWALMGFFGRLSYDYKNKYLLELNSRYDGTSRFPKSSRFGLFPSVSGGWRISSENFFAPVKKYVNDVKLRASYGLLGNQDVGSSASDYYPYIPVMNNGTSGWVNNNGQVKYLSAPNPITPNFTWEKTKSFNIGIDVTIFRNLQLSFDRYRRLTTDMLVNGTTLPGVFGAGSPKQNAGDLQTDGFEFSFDWSNNYKVAGKNMSISFGGNISNYTAKITKFDNPKQLLNNYYVGQQIGEIWGYSSDGLFMSDAEAAAWGINQDQIDLSQRVASPGEWSQLKGGDVKFRDLNGDKVINNGSNTVSDHGDLKVIGNSLPRYAYGFNTRVAWNNFDLSLFFQGVLKQDWYPTVEAGLFWGVFGRPYTSFIPKDFEKDVWTPENKDAYFPIVRGYEVYSGGALNTPNDRYLQNIGYLRLKTAIIGYTLSPQVLGRFRNYIQNVHFYFSGQNLFTFTKFRSKYIDPESVGPYDVDRGAGSYNPNNAAANATDNGARSYPYMKNYTIGVNVTF